MANKKKLIEVALPLEAINKASAREKSIRHGHPSTLHLWWARRPLAAARAVIFAQMVDDPSAYVGTLRADPKLKRKAETVLKARLKVWEEARTLADKAKGSTLSVPEPGPAPTLDEVLADQERQRLFRIIEDLVLWENTTNETVLQAARDEIWASWRRACAENVDHPRAKELFDRKKLPAFHDPFAGGGALPLEAQRLGLESYASDLNPVAVLINKAMIEIPPRFAGRNPVGPLPKGQTQPKLHEDWSGPRGLAEDVRRYAAWMRDRAVARIGQLYPAVRVTAAMAKQRADLKTYEGQELKVIAWLWARTIRSPNPAFGHVEVPLVSSFLLGTKEGREVYLEPEVQGDRYRFQIRLGLPPAAAKNGTKAAGKGSNFFCLLSGSPIEGRHIKAEAQAGRLGSRMICIVAEGKRGRVYLSPTPEHDAAARLEASTWSPTQDLVGKARDQMPLYGMPTFGHLFTARQLSALNTFSDLLNEVQDDVSRRAAVAGYGDDLAPLEQGGCGAKAYAEAISVYLAFAIDRSADYWSAVSSWHSGPKMEAIRNTFGRQAISMTWDFAEANPFSDSSGNWMNNADWCVKAIEGMPGTACKQGFALAENAATQAISANKVVSTDPPYYDNIAYADLSDFFYVWLRRNLRGIFPSLFATVATPKSDELVATTYRHDSKEAAEAFFLNGMTQAMHNLVTQGHPAYPVSIYYAFKQSETKGDLGTSRTGWDTFLQAVLNAGFALTGTWPMRTEMGNRMVSSGTNALASSIILVCRPRAANAPTATRREFVAALRSELPVALAHLQRGNIAPVDLAQAAIGPGMAVYTSYAKVLDAQGKPLAVRDALALINETLDEALAEQEGDFDADTRWALAWFDQHGFAEGEFGVADVLARAKNTSVDGMKDAGILQSRRGKVRLLASDELSGDWDPTTEARLTAWEVVHQLVRALASGGESAAAELVAKLGARAESARELAYRLYALSERKQRAADALAYNGLVQSWPEIVRISREQPKEAGPKARDLFDEET